MSLSKLTLSIGLVQVPVEIENALGDGLKPSGNYVCSESALPFKSTSAAKPTSMKPTEAAAAECGHKHVNACSRAIGYPRADGTYFVPSESDLHEMKAEKDRLIKLDTFVPTADVDPIYFRTTSVIKPQKGGEKAFWLLARRLQKLDRIAVGRAVLDKDEVLLFLRWSKQFDCLFFSVVVYDEQIKRSLIEGVKQSEPAKSYRREEIKFADQIITGVFVKPFDPTDYQPQRWHRLRDLILANGASPSGDLPAPVSGEPIVDLMAALKATVEETKSKAKKPPARKRQKVA